MNILAVGDVVGDAGCNYLRKILPDLKKEKSVDLVIVNGENSAVGNGILPVSAEHLLASGADVITTGNHVFRRREIYNYLEDCPAIIRPANFPASAPGKGFLKLDFGRFQVAIMNLMGTVYMDPLDNPFDCATRMLSEVQDCKIKILDFHAEATGEKKAMGYYLDGKVSVVFGTHTHVQTADEQILPNGTGYLSDLGMTGPWYSVLGVKPELAIDRMHTHMPVRFENAEGPAHLNACLFTVDGATGKCTAVERIQK